MATRVDPELYRDSPIFRELLRERKGRWPGIPLEELPPVSLPTPSAPVDAPQSAPPAMYRVEPLGAAQTARTRPYVAKEFLAYDPEETIPTALPQAAGD